MEKEDEKNQNRITLSIAFIAIYLTLIFGLIGLFDYSDSLIGQIIYGVFIVNGILIVFCFFLYLLFYALELNFSQEKEIFFEIKISAKKLGKIKRVSYNVGIGQIFFSFVYPLYIIPINLREYFNFHFGWSILIVVVLVSLVIIAVSYFISRD